ncbi:MAG: hypothetical protein VZS44_10410 [Bacilli bacterium]|nr:hypothetical protein [Bacilli bacterium]
MKINAPIYILGKLVNGEVTNPDILYSINTHRTDKTSIKVEDLPPYYCEVHNTKQTAYIRTTDLVDVRYVWHFYNPSQLFIGFNGEIQTDDWGFYTNCISIYEKDDIQRILKYIEKYSPQVDLSTVYKEINAEKEKK